MLVGVEDAQPEVVLLVEAETLAHIVQDRLRICRPLQILPFPGGCRGSLLLQRPKMESVLSRWLPLDLGSAVPSPPRFNAVDEGRGRGLWGHYLALPATRISLVTVPWGRKRKIIRWRLQENCCAASDSGILGRQRVRGVGDDASLGGDRWRRRVSTRTSSSPHNYFLRGDSPVSVPRIPWPIRGEQRQRERGKRRASAEASPSNAWPRGHLSTAATTEERTQPFRARDARPHFLHRPQQRNRRQIAAHFEALEGRLQNKTGREFTMATETWGRGREKASAH